eukprot:1164407-Pyramimonas_sp.AAC.1
MDVCPRFQTAVEGLQEVCKMVYEHDSCERLCETCFQDPVGVVLQGTLKKFHAKVNVNRWGTVAFALSEIFTIKNVLRSRWDKSKFVGDSKSKHVKVDVVDSCITDPEWWNTL